MFDHDAFYDLFRRVKVVGARENLIVLGLTEFKERNLRALKQNSRLAFSLFGDNILKWRPTFGYNKTVSL